MRVLLPLLLILGYWDSSGSAAAFGAIGIPMLSVTLLISIYLVVGLEGILVPLIAICLSLDAFSGLPFGSITLAVLASLCTIEAARSRWLNDTSPFTECIVGALCYAVFMVYLLLLQFMLLSRFILPVNPLLILLAAFLCGVVSVLVSTLLTPKGTRLNVASLE